MSAVYCNVVRVSFVAPNRARSRHLKVRTVWCDQVLRAGRPCSLGMWPEQVLVKRDFGRVLCSVTKFYYGGLLIVLTAVPSLRGLLFARTSVPFVPKLVVPFSLNFSKIGRNFLLLGFMSLSRSLAATAAGATVIISIPSVSRENDSSSPYAG